VNRADARRSAHPDPGGGASRNGIPPPPRALLCPSGRADADRASSDPFRSVDPLALASEGSLNEIQFRSTSLACLRRVRGHRCGSGRFSVPGEHKMFGKDGFEDALEKIASIEQSFGLGDLSTLTAPPPPGRA